MSNKIRIGAASDHLGLSVLPLFQVPIDAVDYQLSDEAMRQETVVVEEVSDAGSVSHLVVKNNGERRVLFLEGEHLIGAKQNRVLNTSVLIGAKSKTVVPVTCVEQGRWRHVSEHFHSCMMYATPTLRRTLKTTVSFSLRTRQGHRSDQHSVWAEVSRQQRALGVRSTTSAMSDTFASRFRQVVEFQEKLRYVEGASGVAIAINGRVVVLDLFDQPATCRKVWERLMAGVALNALECQPTTETVKAGDVERLIYSLQNSAWQRVPAIGEGEEARIETETGQYGSKLTLGGRLIHASILAAG
jgi:hypothetical protein